MTGLSILAALAVSMLATAQSNSGPIEPLPPTFHCGDRDDLPMSGKDKTCYWWTQSFNAGMLFGAAFNTALDPLLNGATNKYWGQGVDGFSRRFGTRVTQSMAKGTGQAVVGAIFKEDPRFYPSRKEKFWPRVGFALTHTLIVKHDDGHEWFSVGRAAGAFSSGFSGMAWTPDPINSPRDALVRTGTSMGGVVAASFLREFQPDLTNLISGIFRRPPKAPVKPVKTTGAIQ